jgi:hypothetical protein
MTMNDNANPVHPFIRTVELNIGLLASEHAVDREPFAPISPDTARLAVRDRLHFPALGAFETRVEEGGAEPTLVARLRVPVEFIADGRLAATVYGLAVLLEQDCIAVYYADGKRAGTGALIGPCTALWGAFNADFFTRFEPAD